MKRIRLFEAFNNTEKIDKVNFLTYCWVLEKIISSHNSRIEFKTAPVLVASPDGISAKIARARGVVIYVHVDDKLFFEYNHFTGISKVWNIEKVRRLMIDYLTQQPIRLSFFSDKSLNYVLKKLYLDEKNKTI